MWNIVNSQKHNLPDIAACHIKCFPQSLATKLGSAYVQQTFGWYLNTANRFLFHIETGNKVIGYCGGFVPSKPGDGSSSGMMQHAFNKAIKGLLLHPWLLFHSEVVPHYPFLWRNIKRKLTGKIKPATPVDQQASPFKPYCGLVVIAVHPDFRGKGVAQQLMDEFEQRAKQLRQNDLILSVKKDNGRALNAYTNYGWKIFEEQPVTYVMKKTI
jgi:ribosomal protein S18 acetylase RimI-like enzyme